MLYQFKAKPEDFIVKELLWFEPKGSWEVFFVLFEKKNKNTMDIVNDICKNFWWKRNDIGIAGLKDKIGITQQWISVRWQKLKQIWWSHKFLWFLKRYSKILKTTRHNDLLRVGEHWGNTFTIRLRALPKLMRHEHKKSIERLVTERLEEIKKEWFPNCFGQQRFGKWGRNFKRAQEILQHISNETDQFEIKFKLQAYASMFFNDYTLSRRLTKKKLVQGDIMIDKYHGFWVKVGVYEKDEINLFDYEECKNNHKTENYFFPEKYTTTVKYSAKTRVPTGPILWFNLLLPPKDSVAYKLDRKLLEITKFLKQGILMSKKYNLFGVRRPLWVMPEHLTYKRDKDDIILSFDLPTGSYATVLLGFLFDKIDYKTCLENKRTIPNTLHKA